MLTDDESSESDSRLLEFGDQVGALEALTLHHWEEPPPAAPQISSELSGDLSMSIKEPLREQDRLLPVANVAHLLASELPTGAKVSRDAKLFAQEVVSEFICFITSEANDVCLLSKQKAITQADISKALDNLGDKRTSVSNAPKL